MIPSVLGAAGLIASLILAGVFVTAGVAKLADRTGTRTSVQEFGAPARLAGILGLLLPLAELTVAALLLYAPTRTAGGAGASALLIVFSTAIAARLARGDAPRCRCFGQLNAAPVSWKTLARNGILVVLSGTALSAGLAGATPSALGWLARLDSSGRTLSVLAIAVAAIAVAGVMAFVSLLRSYGRVLLRVDELERRLTAAGLNDAKGRDVPPMVGHPPGTDAPAFAVAGTNGAAVSLSDLLAPRHPLLLVFTSRTCAPCRLLLPDIAAWQRDHVDRLTIAIVNDGDREAGRAEASEHRLERVLSDPDLAVYKAYEAAGTPSAVLIAADGTIASYLAAGSESIRELVARTVSDSRPAQARELPLGSPVPELSVTALDGRSLSLARLGAATLVVFWNPSCGYCASMRDDLRQWERHAPAGAPRLLIVSSGDETSTRADGFSSTIALDPAFRVGAAFGAGGTPMAVLVDVTGRIASPLAAGAEAVFALAGGRGSVESDTAVPVGRRGRL